MREYEELILSEVKTTTSAVLNDIKDEIESVLKLLEGVQNGEYPQILTLDAIEFKLQALSAKL